MNNTDATAGGNAGDWLRVTIAAPPEMTDALFDFLEEVGSEGAFEEIPETPVAKGSAAAASTAVLQAFLPLDERLEQRLADLGRYIASLADLFPDLEAPALQTRVIRDPGWGEAWKQFFKPLRVSPNVIIKPTWEPFSPQGREIVIEIDPGMAFGTGQHPSTRMCLQAIDELFAQEPDAGGWRVLDVGTGTGILGIAAAKFGARHVLCIDNDPLATAAALENGRVNQVEDRVRVSGQAIAEIAGPCELVVANLTSNLLIALYPELVRLLTAGGRLVISGIVEPNRPDIEARFLNDLFPARRLLREQEWLCYVLQKAGGGR